MDKLSTKSIKVESEYFSTLTYELKERHIVLTDTVCGVLAISYDNVEALAMELLNVYDRFSGRQGQ